MLLKLLRPTVSDLREKAVRDTEMALYHARLIALSAQCNVESLTKQLDLLKNEALAGIHCE